MCGCVCVFVHFAIVSDGRNKYFFIFVILIKFAGMRVLYDDIKQSIEESVLWIKDDSFVWFTIEKKIGNNVITINIFKLFSYEN